jgi:hypothetical protein
MAKEMRVMSSGPEYRGERYGPDRTEILGTTDASRRRRLHLAGLLVVAVIALAGGAGVAYAVTNTGSKVAADSSAGGQPQTSAGSAAPSAPSWGGRGPAGPRRFGGFGFGGFGGAIHGRVTEPKSGGGYQTVDVQRGTVTAVSSSSITVKSADGFLATYAVTGSTDVNAQAAGIGTVKTGDIVDLTATVSGGTATAASIIDMTSIRASRGAFGFPGGPPAGSPGGPPAGNPS